VVKGILNSLMAGTEDNNGAFDLCVIKMARGTEPPSHVHSREAVGKMNVPAERMEVPKDADTVTYANADMTETIKVFERYGLRFLTADEIRGEMPEYPL
jgi:hypothetical protein